MKRLIIVCLMIELLGVGYTKAGIWTTLDMPGASWTGAYSISGSNIVGCYHDTFGYHGFLYNGSGWTTLDMPGALYTFAYGIDGSHIVGHYYDAYGDLHGFLYTIPEPATIGLLGLGGLALLKKRRA